VAPAAIVAPPAGTVSTGAPTTDPTGDPTNNPGTTDGPDDPTGGGDGDTGDPGTTSGPDAPTEDSPGGINTLPGLPDSYGSDDDTGACACRSPAAPGAAPSLLVLAALALPRRRRR